MDVRVNCTDSQHVDDVEETLETIALWLSVSFVITGYIYKNYDSVHWIDDTPGRPFGALGTMPPIYSI